MKPQHEISAETQHLAIANASSELAEVVYDLMTEAMRQGTDLSPEFRLWISRMTAHRSKPLLEKLCFRAFRVGVDQSLQDDFERPTMLPEK